MSDYQQRTAEEIQQDLHREIGKALKPTEYKFKPAHIDLKRYRKVRWFFAKAFIHIIFWDILLNRPGLRWLRRDPIPRWQKISRNFRYLALEMGGVLIKLGQFLSIRVDVLPSEVTTELAGLRDEIPAESFDEIVAQIEEDFSRPVGDLFEWISPEPSGCSLIGSGSFGPFGRDWGRGSDQGFASPY